MERKQLEQNTRQHARSKLRILNVHDVVYLRSRDSFKPKFTGPFEVISKDSEVNYTIRRLHDPTCSSFKVHIDRLRLAPHRRQHLEVRQPISQHTSHQYNLRSRHI